VKSPIQRRAAIAALLLAPVLAACGFNEQTDQVYQPAVGVNDRSGTVDILNALIVSGSNGSGTFAGTLVNTASEDDRLDSVTGPGITAAPRTVVVKAGDNVPLGKSGDLTLTGSGIKPGTFVELTFSFSSGQSTTVRVPVVEAGGDYTDVPLPSPSASRTPTPSKSSSKSPSASSSASPSASPSAQ
jgi:hypothetical protein